MIDVLNGDCIELMRSMPAASLDSCVTDPPYHLTSIVKRFGKPGAAPARSQGATGVYGRASAGFMGQTWDGGEIAYRPETWAEVLRVLKPGAYLLAFGGTRTFHRVAVAIEDAGFEIRDCIMWVYGSGFPKSHDVGKKVPEYEGWGTALKPAWEPIIVARAPLVGTVAANVTAHGTGALNIDACRVGNEVRTAAFTSLAPCGGNALGAAGTQEARRGTQGAPKTYVGRWPANVMHDGSDEVLAAFPDAKGQQGAARFFYCAKASKADRGAGNTHPTVKPQALMRYLCRLVTPPGGTVLDPFAGSGSTGVAALHEGFRAVLCEQSDDYVRIIRSRTEPLLGVFG